MNKSNLTQYQKKRFIQLGHRCKGCGELITNTEDIILIKKHIGKLVQYSFYHERCADGKEETTATKEEIYQTTTATTY